uniref:Uncharacterized protein n=1 Tax=viral metagenome TaxID=1070528 RepID=A0A6M3KVI3_9ZZZZ
MAELPRSWERMIKESIGAEEQTMALKPEGYREIGLGEGLENIARAWLEDKAPWMKEQKEYGTLEETLAALESGEIPLTESMLMRTGTKILAKGARDYLAMARGATDPAMYKQATKVVRDVLRTGRKVPQSFWDPVKVISWDPTLGGSAGTQLADAWPWQKSAAEISTIKYNPRTADATTVWHELAHARQYKPRGGTVPYRGAEMTEQEAAEYIAQSSSLLKTGLSAQEYSAKYYGSDPLETSAEAFARLMTKGKGADPEATYNLILGRALEGFEGKLPKEARQAYFRFQSRSE